MPTPGESDLPSWDADWDDPERDEGEGLEALIEHADRPYGAESYGTTAEEAEEGEPLDLRLREEQPDRPLNDSGVVIEDDGDADVEAELVGQADVERDPLVPPEEAAVTIREGVPGGVDDPVD